MTAARPSGYAARPDYRVDLLTVANRVVVRVAGQTLAASAKTLVVDEQGHEAVLYFPRGDVDMTALIPLPGRVTHCPYKGDADYWALAAAPGDPVAWSYADPFPQVAALAGAIAFDRRLVLIRPDGR